MIKVFAFIGIVGILVAVAALVFFFGGFYDISVTAGDPRYVAWAIPRVRQASIERYAQERPPFALDDPAITRAGARAFVDRHCVICHGGPGMDRARFAAGMHPEPPELKDLALAPQHIFWIVKNGINMTAMPSFGSIEVSDREIWTIVAFIRNSQSVSEEDFKSWTAPAVSPSTAPSDPNRKL